MTYIGTYFKQKFFPVLANRRRFDKWKWWFCPFALWVYLLTWFGFPSFMLELDIYFLVSIFLCNSFALIFCSHFLGFFVDFFVHFIEFFVRLLICCFFLCVLGVLFIFLGISCYLIISKCSYFIRFFYRLLIFFVDSFISHIVYHVFFCDFVFLCFRYLLR